MLGYNSAGTPGQTNFDDLTFNVAFTAGPAGMSLAAFSDDGVTIDIKDETTGDTQTGVIANKGRGQALPDLGNSIKDVPYPFVNGRQYTITIHYLNTQWTNSIPPDIDGVTLIAYAGEPDCCEIESVTSSSDLVAVGEPVTFTASGPQGACLDKVKWTTSPSVTATDPQPMGETLSATWTTTGADRTATATCPGGSTAGKTVTVVGVKEVIIDGSSDPEDEGPSYLCDCAAASLTLRALPNPSAASFPQGEPTWALKRWFPALQQWSTVDTGSGETFEVDSPEPGTYQAIATCGSSSDAFDVIVQEKSKVGMVVDTQAIEGGSDNITILFVRIGGDQSRQLNVKFSADFSSSASQSDLEDDSGRSALLDGNILIAANQSASDPITLKATADTDEEQIEYFTVQVSGDCCYDVVSRDGLDVTKKDNQDAVYRTKCMILDCMALYAAGTDDVPLDTGNPGIHVSDIRQGGIGDCYAMAAMLAVAQECWQTIQGRISDNSNGTYSVTLWNGSSWDNYTVDGALTRGFDAARLTGDVDDDGCAETWPIILEAALAQMLGSYDALGDGGVPPTVYDALTGASSPVGTSTAGKTDDEIFQMIANAIGVGKQVSVGTFNTLDPGVRTVTKAYGNHAYVVEFIDPGVIDLKNPWGQDHVPLSADYLTEVVQTVYVLDSIACP